MLTYTMKNLYGNCKVLSPQGYLMFRCREKKINWYLKRDLATIINDDPLTIKLNFEPKGYGNHQNDYGLNEMLNICVNCGDDDMLTRHHIVPYCYRKYFTLNLKSHNFHDILLLCVDCHEEYENHALVMKQEIGREHGAPINGIIDTENKEIIKLKKMANALLSHSKVPDAKIRRIREHLRNEFGWKRVTRKRLIDICETKIIRHKKTHGEIVVSEITDFTKFIKRWRQHFLDHNDCQHLPENWSVDYDY